MVASVVMRSPRGLGAALVLLLAVPVTALYQMVFADRRGFTNVSCLSRIRAAAGNLVGLRIFAVVRGDVGDCQPGQDEDSGLVCAVSSNLPAGL